MMSITFQVSKICVPSLVLLTNTVVNVYYINRQTTIATTKGLSKACPAPQQPSVLVKELSKLDYKISLLKKLV